MSLEKIFKFLPLLALTVIVTGCFSAPAPPPSILHSDSYTALTDQEQRILPVTDKSFTIEDAVRIGLANSPTYESARLALDLAYNTFYQDIFNYIPTASLSVGGVSIGHGHSLSADGTVTSAIAYGSPSLTGSGHFTVFNGLSREMDLLSSYETAKATAEALKFSRLALINQIINLYYDIVLTKEEIAITKANLSFQKEMLENTRYTYKNNLVTYDYVLNYEFNYKTQQAGLVNQQLNFKVKEYALAALLGLTTAKLPDGIKYVPIDELIRSLKRDFSSLGVEFYLDIAIDQRPDLKQVRLTLQSSRFDLYSAWGAFSPTISASASYSLTSSDWRYSGQNLNYGLSASWDVLSAGFSRIFNVRSAQINLAKSKLTVLQKWIAVVKDVRTTYLDLQMSLIDETLRTEAVELAERQRDMVKMKFENQLESITRLNQVQDSLVLAQLDKARAIIAVYRAKTNLNTACGIQRY